MIYQFQVAFSRLSMPLESFVYSDMVFFEHAEAEPQGARSPKGNVVLS